MATTLGMWVESPFLSEVAEAMHMDFVKASLIFQCLPSSAVFTLRLTHFHTSAEFGVGMAAIVSACISLLLWKQFEAVVIAEGWYGS